MHIENIIVGVIEKNNYTDTLFLFYIKKTLL